MQMTAITGLQDVQFFGMVVEHGDFLRSKMLGRKQGSDHATAPGGSTGLTHVLGQGDANLFLSVSPPG